MTLNSAAGGRCLTLTFDTDEAEAYVHQGPLVPINRPVSLLVQPPEGTRGKREDGERVGWRKEVGRREGVDGSGWDGGRGRMGAGGTEGGGRGERGVGDSRRERGGWGGADGGNRGERGGKGGWDRGGIGAAQKGVEIDGAGGMLGPRKERGWRGGVPGPRGEREGGRGQGRGGE